MSFTDKQLQIDTLRQEIDARGLLPDEVLKKVNYKFRLEWNYHSNSMEGNSLTKQETRSVMVGNITVEGKPIKDVLEMKGHDDVISNILKMGKGELNISEKRIKEIHKGIMHEEIPEKAKFIGQWKTTANHLFNYKNERFDFVTPADVPERMHQLINWLNTQKEKIQRGDKDAVHPVMMAFRFHLDYTTIHPFYDGNGRTARILTNLILISYGYPPIYIKTEEKATYYQYLADIQGYGGEPDLFYDFMAGLLIRSLQMVKDAVEGKEIAEPDDWEKRLSLLKQELRIDKKEQVGKSVDATIDITRNSIIPLVEKVIAKLTIFNELFSQTRVLLGDEDFPRPIENGGLLKSELIQIGHIENLYSIAFHYELKGFKKNSNFSTSSILIWRFEEFRYLLFLNVMDYNKAISKLYNEHYTEEEMSGVVNELAGQLLKRIEDYINQ